MYKIEIKEIIKEYLKNISGQESSDEDNLFDTNVLDSFGMVEFLTYLENSLGFEIEPEMVLQKNFESINAILSLLEKKEKDI